MLCNLSTAVEEIFAVTRLISSSHSQPATFEVQPNVPAAIASLYQGEPASPPEQTQQST